MLPEDHNDIEVFDSILPDTAVRRAEYELKPETSEVIHAALQLKPGARKLRWVTTQQQLPGGNGCGPLALNKFWCLATGKYPQWFSHAQERI